MNEPTEKVIQAKIAKYVRSRGGLVVNYSPGAFGQRGVSDLLVCFYGRFLAIEVKRPSTAKRLTPLQKGFLSGVERAGGVTAICTTIDEARAVLDGLDAFQRALELRLKQSITE